jgi:hypothetical protein
MTEAQARKLADFDRNYRPMRLRSGRWIVWDDRSEHEVEFNEHEFNGPLTETD